MSTVLIRPVPGYCMDTKTAKGRGVFSSRKIAKGDVVEVCPVILFDRRVTPLPELFALRVFNWGALTGSSVLTSAFALGWGSLYNHANPANMRFIAPFAGELLLTFEAVRDIDPNEELTINYNSSVDGIHSLEDDWFEGTGIQPI